MRKARAKKYFLGEGNSRRLNCAQAVIEAYRDLFGVPEGETAQFAQCGGGRAPEGKCGAYYAAQYLVARKDAKELVGLEQLFKTAAGSLRCRDIRRQGKLSCVGCVEVASEFLEGGCHDS